MFAPDLARSVLALCWLVPAGCAGAQVASFPSTAVCPVAIFWHQEADLAGTYQGYAPAKDAARRVFTLDLAADGAATLTTLFLGKDRARQSGRWARNGSQVVLTFDPMGPNQPPGPITFRHRNHSLSPIRWDASEWGRSGPPVLHRSRSTAVQGGA
jgi:NlpE N-terminal domain